MDKSEEHYDLVIKATKNRSSYWEEIWEYKDLLYILVWRDLKVRYKQTLLGVLWSVLQPLLTMVVFTFIFSQIAELPTEAKAPYPILVFSALIPWQFFSSAISGAGNSLIANQTLITKVYFPRTVIPASTVIASLFDMIISLAILILLIVYYSFIPSWKICLLPLLILHVFLFTMGLSLLISSYNIKYRDFRYIIPFAIQFGLLISPIGFSSTVIPDNLYYLYSLNPMVGIIDGFRWSILNSSGSFNLLTYSISIFISIIIFLAGVYKFKKIERSISDII